MSYLSAQRKEPNNEPEQDVPRRLRRDHPDLTDHHGRVWVWIGKDLYSHCSMAWPHAMVTDGQHQLPSVALHTNPNYHLCATCKGEQTDAS